jgi:DNA repair exonuclease SbcCD nuclease subunit
VFRLLQYSDSHLGFEQYSSPVRLKDFAASLDEVLRVAVEMNVDAVVDTGDTFNSPNPDPFSLRAMRLFLEALNNHHIRFIGVIGNHNRHEMQGKIPGASWFDALSDNVVRPADPEMPIRVESWKREDCFIDIVVADWMPSSDIQAFVTRIPRQVDALFMHQSCEQFLPIVARPELMISQVDGLARYVGVGDVHITKVLTTTKGTIIGSSGSTEMSKRDEDPLKYVMLITLDCDDRTKAPTCEKIQIVTRGVVTFPVIMIAEHIQPFIDTVARSIIPGQKPPMVVVAYSRNLQPEMAVASGKIRDMGVEIIRLIPETEVKTADEVQQVITSGSVLMVEIIEEMLKENRPCLDLCLDLWASPTSAPVIIESYIQQIKIKYANQGSSAQECVPTPPP